MSERCGAVLFASGLILSGLPAWAQFTESPVTVAPGEWLMETDVVSVAFDRHTPWNDGVHYRSIYVGYVQVSTGLTANLDLQLGLDAWREERAQGTAAWRARGLGELYVRAKWQFWQSGDTGVAILPYYLVRETAHRDLRPLHSQFGVILPWSTPLNPTWTLGGQLQLDWLSDGMGGRDSWYTATVVASRSVTETVGLYLEAITYFSPQSARNWATSVGGGVTWQMTEKFSWDLGALVGCTRIAPDFNPVLRFVWAF